MRPVTIYDLDGTLIERQFSRIIPTPWLEQILAIGIPAAICSNQGGISWNLAGGRPGKTYPNWRGVVERVSAGMRLAGVSVAFVALYHPGATLPTSDLLWQRGAEIELPPELICAIGSEKIVQVPIRDGIIFASWSPYWRKPAPGMLLTARELLSAEPPCVYVGDEDDDRTAAGAAGMGFVDVRQFY